MHLENDHYKFCNSFAASESNTRHAFDLENLKNALFCFCGIKGMRALPANSIPLVVTSPPFDSLREYGGHDFDFGRMAAAIYRVVAPGGVLCWHVQEQVINGKESGTVSEQRLFFRKLGFDLNTTIIVAPEVPRFPSFGRYGPTPQYVLVLSNGKPRTFNPIVDVPNKTAGATTTYQNLDHLRGTTRKKTANTASYRQRSTVWTYPVGYTNSADPEARLQSASMPEALARDLIRSWSNPRDLVLDPMSGSGTTAKMAFLEGRHYLGFEINPDYHDLAVKRLERTWERLCRRDSLVAAG